MDGRKILGYIYIYFFSDEQAYNYLVMDQDHDLGFLFWGVFDLGHVYGIGSN